MANRALEVLIVALLVIATVGAVFQFQNHQLLRDILIELRADAARTPTVAEQHRPQYALIAPPLWDRPADPGAAAAPQAVDPRRIEPGPPPATAAAPEQPPSREPEPGAASAPPQPALADRADRADEEPTLNVGGLEATLDSLVVGPAAQATAERPPAGEAGIATADREDRPAVAAPSPEPAAVTEEPSPEWEEHGEVVVEVIEHLLGGEYAQVVERFNSLMARNLSEAELAAAIDPERSRYGGFERVLSHSSTTDGVDDGLTMFEVDVELTSGHQLSFTITLDERQRVCGLLMR